MTEFSRSKYTKALPDYVGVRHTFFTHDLKRDALVFDRLAIPGLDNLVRSRNVFNQEELEFLIESGIIYNPVIKENESLKWVREQQRELDSPKTIPNDAKLDEMDNWPERWKIDFFYRRET